MESHTFNDQSYHPLTAEASVRLTEQILAGLKCGEEEALACLAEREAGEILSQYKEVSTRNANFG